MSQLFLVRHAQAVFPYDEKGHLSDVGRKQATLLGAYWCGLGQRLDQVYMGPSGRHCETAALVGEQFHRHGLSWPEPVILPDLDEYDSEALLSRIPDFLRSRDARVAELFQAREAEENEHRRERLTLRILETSIARWANEEVALQGLETWTQFCQRVNQGLSQIVENGARGRKVAVFTSGGPISVAAMRALRTSTEATLRLAWLIRNTSVSEFLFSGDRFSLTTWNAFPHLREPSVLTFR